LLCVGGKGKEGGVLFGGSRGRGAWRGGSEERKRCVVTWVCFGIPETRCPVRGGGRIRVSGPLGEGVGGCRHADTPRRVRLPLSPGSRTSLSRSFDRSGL